MPSPEQAATTAQAAGPRPATSTLSIPTWVTAPASSSVPPSRRGAGAARERLLYVSLAGPPVACTHRPGPAGTGRTHHQLGEGDRDVQAWTQAPHPQEERRQPRQAPQRLAGPPFPPRLARRGPLKGGRSRTSSGRPASAQAGVGRSWLASRTTSVVPRSPLTWVPSSSKVTVVSCILIRSRRPGGGASPPHRRRTSALNSCWM